MDLVGFALFVPLVSRSIPSIHQPGCLPACSLLRLKSRLLISLFFSFPLLLSFLLLILSYIPPHGEPVMNQIESRRDLPDNTRPSPAPSTAGSTGTSSVTVRTGPNGQMSFRRCVRFSVCCSCCRGVGVSSRVKSNSTRPVGGP